MKIPSALILGGAALLAYAFSMPPYIDEAAFTAKYMQMSAGQSEQYWALRESMLTPRFKLQDYGITAILLGLGLGLFQMRGLRGPAKGSSLVALAFAVPFLTVGGYVVDLFLGQARGEFPHWADSLGIPLMGAPVMLVILLGWALLHLLFLYGGFKPSAPLRDALGQGKNYWLLGVATVTLGLVCWCVALGQYYYAVPGVLWLFLYLSLGAGSQRLAANNSFKPKPLRGSA